MGKRNGAWPWAASGLTEGRTLCSPPHCVKQAGTPRVGSKLDEKVDQPVTLYHVGHHKRIRGLLITSSYSPEHPLFCSHPEIL